MVFFVLFFGITQTKNSMEITMAVKKAAKKVAKKAVKKVAKKAVKKVAKKAAKK